MAISFLPKRFPRMACVALLSLGLANQVSEAQDFERYKPKTLDIPQNNIPQIQSREIEATGSDKALVKRLDAIKVLDAATKVNPQDANSKAKGVILEFEDRESLVYSERFQSILQNYIGGPISLRKLNQLSRDIIQFYRQSDQPVVDVQIPEQKITGGTVQIIIVESRVGDVIIEAGPYYNPDILKKFIGSTYSGSRVYESSIMDDLFWLNQSPFRIVDVDLRPGSGEGTTDVVFHSNEVLPWRAYLGYEDSGVRGLDLERTYAGLVWGNAMGRNGMLSYQYTANATFDKLHAHAATWQKAFNREWSGQLSGSWATFSPTILPFLTQNGESWQATGQVFRHLQKNRYVDQSISLGMDYKSTNNNLEFGGVNVLGTGADLVNLRLGIRHLARQENGDYFLIQNDLFVSPGNGFTAGHNTVAFRTIRAATSPDYIYNRLRTQSRFDMGDMQLVVRNVGQYAFDRLLFSETLGMGGYDSIRGYDQRVFNGDSGWITNFEFGPKPFELAGGSCNFYGFFDMGKAYTRDPQPGEFNDLFLMSTGLGMRLSLSESSQLRLDYGHGLERAPGIATRDRIHVGYVHQFGPRPSK